ncbi:MAG: hypothetical protein R8J94_05120 [Acidimicrobiia bacterium]|nr:hypothetical protein [Acidimicrobiia bacterium]
MTIEVDKRFRQSTSGLHQRSIAGVTVLHRETWESPLVLNRELNLVWTCLEFGGSIEEIADDIVDVFGGVSERVPEKVEVAFRTLADLDLIEPVEPG